MTAHTKANRNAPFQHSYSSLLLQGQVNKVLIALRFFSGVPKLDSFLRTARRLRVMYEIIDAVELSKRWSLPLSWVREYTRSRTKDTIPHLRLGHYVRFQWDSPELNQWLERHAVNKLSKYRELIETFRNNQ